MKNVETQNASSGLAVATLIMAEANRREHLNGAISSVQWDREMGIGIKVDDFGHVQHLANALDIDPDVRDIYMPAGMGDGRGRIGTYAGFKIVIWTIEL